MDEQVQHVMDSYCPPENWNWLEKQDSQVVWDRLAPLLSFQGFALRGSKEYSERPPPPTSAPKNPFKPGLDEAFIDITPECKAGHNFYLPFNPLVRSFYNTRVH